MDSRFDGAQLRRHLARRDDTFVLNGHGQTDRFARQCLPRHEMTDILQPRRLDDESEVARRADSARRDGQAEGRLRSVLRLSGNCDLEVRRDHDRAARREAGEVTLRLEHGNHSRRLQSRRTGRHRHIGFIAEGYPQTERLSRIRPAVAVARRSLGPVVEDRDRLQPHEACDRSDLGRAAIGEHVHPGHRDAHGTASLGELRRDHDSAVGVGPRAAEQRRSLGGRDARPLDRDAAPFGHANLEKISAGGDDRRMIDLDLPRGTGPELHLGIAEEVVNVVVELDRFAGF